MSSSVAKFLVLAKRIVYLALHNRHGLREVLGIASAEAEKHLDVNSDVSFLPSVGIDEIAADQAEGLTATIYTVPQVRASITLFEAVALAVLTRKSGGRRIFEFGTYRGISTNQLILNASEGAEIFTLDLPVENLRTQFKLDTPGEFEVVEDARKGDLIPANLRPRVTFLSQDSAAFDPAPYEGTMDLVFVDGAHTLEYVTNDSEKGWRMLRPGGIIAWHDCRFNSPGVARFLRASTYRPKRIAGGTVAFAVKE